MVIGTMLPGSTAAPAAPEGAPRVRPTAPLWDIAAAMGIMAAATALARGPGANAEFLRAAVGLPAALAVPGYLLMLVLFPRRTALRRHERWTLAVVLSAALCIFAAWALSRVHASLTAAHVTGALLLLDLALAVPAAGIRRRTRDPYRPSPIPSETLTVGALGIALLVTAGLVATAGLNTRATAFFVTGGRRGAMLQGYPFTLNPGQGDTVVLHITNPQPRRRRFELITLVDARMWATRAVTIPARGRWSLPVRLPTRPSGRLRVAFILKQPPSSRIFRELWLFYTVRAVRPPPFP